MKQPGAPNLLNDVRLLNCPWEDAGQWIINDWAPRAAEAGIRHLAHVTMPKAYTEVWIKSMEKHSDNFSLKMFKSLEEAQAWLKGNMPALSLDEDALLGESSYIRSSAYLEKDLKITA